MARRRIEFSVARVDPDIVLCRGMCVPLAKVRLFDSASENEFTLLADGGEYSLSGGDRTGPYREFVRKIHSASPVAGLVISMPVW